MHIPLYTAYDLIHNNKKLLDIYIDAQSTYIYIYTKLMYKDDYSAFLEVEH